MSASLRLPEIDDWIRSLGCSPFPVSSGTLQATRADLDALVETCPVGVVVFHAASGAPLSLNGEARRIVAGLDMSDGSAERLREAVVCRRGEGREVTLGDLGNAETVRAEDVEIFAPGGKSVRTLLDATPIRSPEGAVERVVTLRDQAPFEALEQLAGGVPGHGELRDQDAAGCSRGILRHGRGDRPPLALSRATGSGVVCEPVGGLGASRGAGAVRGAGGRQPGRDRRPSATDSTGPGAAAIHRPLGISPGPERRSFEDSRNGR